MSGSPVTSDPSQPGRRTAAAAGRRRPDATLVLAVLLPLVAIGLALLVRPPMPTTPTRAPVVDALSRATLVCPGGGTSSVVATATDATGEVTAKVGQGERRVRLAPRTLTRFSGNRPVVVIGEDDLAPGLVGSVRGRDSASTCRAPRNDQWFTGVGAGARHLSTLELVNPDAGPALVDVQVYGRRGIVDAPGLRGLAVPGNGRARVDLASVVPRRDDLALRVTTARGRVGASVLDRYDQLGAGASSTEWLPSQPAPLDDNLLLGLPTGQGQRTLVLANAGDDEARATLQVVTETSVFTPEGIEDVTLAPQSVTRVSLSKVLGKAALRDAIGLRVSTTAPVTASLRAFLSGDLSHTVAAEPFSEDTTVLVPEGGGQLLLSGATGAGSVEVTARDAAGAVVTRRTLDVVADRGYTVPLPAKVALVEVAPRGTPVAGAVLVTDAGRAVLPLVELQRTGLVAQVRPGLR